ncbi:hypothetical protein FHQ18_00605 [Deferribacter autotrophicus]|uniref:histidine kinase n=1 Tax=Deferribacter autotrophicus TaxID=500465 RepID=A0A5A8F930_9BACT|nr:ATP-binding protein [Deferribacter autotrophicus]KAA0259412.1 hypothetical protein FHQ18_00605 [Deferribacter autotrophicus]
MKKLSGLFKKHYILIVVLVLSLYITVNIINLFIFYKILNNNILTLSSFIKTFSNTFEKDVNKKLDYIVWLYEDIKTFIEKNDSFSASLLVNYIKHKHHDSNVDVALISNKGVIYDTTFKSELGLNLWELEDARKALIDVKNSGRFRIDFPVLDITHQFFHLYLLDYLPGKGMYLQLSYKLDLLNELKDNFGFLGQLDDIRYYLNVVYFFEQNDFKVYSLGNKKVDKNQLEKLEGLYKENKSELIEKGVYFFNFYKILNFNINKGTPYGIAYVLKITLLSNKNLLFFIIIINLLVLITYYLIYRYYYKKINKTIINPIRNLANFINKSSPVLDSDFEVKIDEIHKLKSAYISHLENIRLRDFVGELIKVQDKEREKIAREIHDTVLQELNYVLIQLKRKNENDLAEMVKSVNSQLRSIIADNFLSTIKMLGFEKLLLQMVDEYERKYSEFSFNVNIEKTTKKIEIDNFIASNIIRVVQEIINNAITHSRGDKIDIQVEYNGDLLKLIVSDNGKGFDAEKEFAKKGHFGLVTIRERIYLLKGLLNIVSNEKGTIYFIDIPIQNKK